MPPLSLAGIQLQIRGLAFSDDPHPQPLITAALFSDLTTLPPASPETPVLKM